MKTKSIRAFTKDHKRELDAAIRGRPGMENYGRKLDDEERRLWVLNDEGLYNWARSAGVNVTE